MYTLVKTVLISVLLWLTLQTLVYYIGLTFFIPEELESLAKRGKTISGKVVGRSLEEHELLKYTFIVAEIEYTGLGYSGLGNESSGNLNPGSTILVTYDPANPSRRYLGFPDLEVQDREETIRALAIGVPFWPVIAFCAISIGISITRRKQQNLDEI